MSDFIVSARKYRPSTFDKIIGQDSITSTLQNAIKNNQLAQSFLFCGPRGVGKTTCARIFAREINQFNDDNNTSDFSFNIFELDAASNNLVDDIRSLTDQVRIPPQRGKYKVYIIDEVHMLSTQAFNAFLKTLEEPPPHAKFILATTEKNKIIPTILSRCQIFDFKRVGVKDISNYLSFVAKNESIKVELEALSLIANKSDGSVRDALSLFDRLVNFSDNNLTYHSVLEHLNILDYDYYFKIGDAIQKNDITTLLNVFNNILENGFDGNHFINGLASHFRDLLVSKDENTIDLLEKSDSLKLRYLEQSRLYDIQTLLRSLEICNKCDIQYKSATNKRLLVEFSLMSMSSKEYKESQKKNSKSFIVSKHKKVSKEFKKINDTVNLPVDVKLETDRIKNESEEIITSDIEIQSNIVLEQKKITEQIGKKRNHISNNNSTTTIDEQNSEPTKSKSRTISINSSISDINEQKKENKRLSIRKSLFSSDDMLKAWREMVSSVKKKGKLNLALALGYRTPILKSTSEIEILLSNSSQAELVEEEKYMLIDLLKDSLRNDEVKIITKVIDPDSKSIPYTNKDKFNKMLEDNNTIKELQSELGLDPDY